MCNYWLFSLFFFLATEPPPKFDEAVSMKAPISVVDMEDVQLPSYEEYVRRYSNDSHTIMLPPEHNSSSRQIQSSNYSNNVLISSSVIQPSLCISCGEAVSKSTTTQTHGDGNCWRTRLRFTAVRILREGASTPTETLGPANVKPPWTVPWNLVPVSSFCPALLITYSTLKTSCHSRVAVVATRRTR